MGQDQRQAMATWSSGKYPVPGYYTKRNFPEKVEEINRRLFFTTWEKVRQIHVDINVSDAIAELHHLRDTYKDPAGIPLVLNAD